ncbi:hypothetical protein ACFLZY_03000 [Patescibacteria group bacterium]
MTENLFTNREQLFQEIVQRGRSEGVTAQDAYDELVKTVIEDHRRVGEIHDDSATVDWAEQLQGRWFDYVRTLGLDQIQPQL